MSEKTCTRTTLDRLTPGDAGAVLDVGGQGAFRTRLLDMGFVAGARVRVIKEAPLNDPVEYSLGGTHVTLRRHEAAQILVEPHPRRRRRRHCGPRGARGGDHGARRRFGPFHR